MKNNNDQSKETDKDKKEIITCRYPEDKVNSQAARQWMKAQTGHGQGKNIRANKRTALRLYGKKG